MPSGWDTPIVVKLRHKNEGETAHVLGAFDPFPRDVWVVGTAGAVSAANLPSVEDTH